MKKDEIQYFNAGLKLVIKRDWPTQEEFAKDVTSKVNLSKILGGNAGTSGSMRERLAQKAGMTVEEIIAIGKGTTEKQSTATEPETVKSNVSGAPFNADTLSRMSSNEILNKISDYSAGVTLEVATHTKSMADTIKMLVGERNRLLELLRVEQVGSFLYDALKVVTKEFKIEDCNRAYTEKFQQVVGDTCAGGKCICATDCLAQKAFAKGGSVSSQILHEDHPYFVTAYPISSSTGINDKAIVTIRDLQWVWDGLENGDILHSKDGFQPEEK